MSISIVIITRNRKEKLARCLDSITKNMPNASVIVIDNGSNDGTNILGNMPRIKILHTKENIGVAPARNLGLYYAKKNFGSKYFVFLDDDAFIEKFSIDEIEKTFYEHSDCGIIAPLILYPDGRIQESLRSFPTVKALLWRGLGLFKLYKPNFYDRYVNPARIPDGRVDWAIGACLIIRKEVFETVGNFDEHYFFGYEDADICRRAFKKNFKTIYNPIIVIKHDYARTSSKLFHISTLRHIKSILRFLFKS